MRYIGLDLGTKTLGISISDLTKTIASPYRTIRFEDENYNSLIPILKEIVESEKVEKIILGLPKNMNNSIGHRAIIALEFSELIKENLKIEVIMQDERRSSIEANNFMLQFDLSRKKRKKKKDELAANIILQRFLDKEKEK